MRMDRYEEDNIDISKKSRTDKNQELYTDVYLNNAYVDIEEINEVVNDKDKIEERKVIDDSEMITYTYEDKNYDIVSLVNEAIKNNEDNLKRSLEKTTEIENIIKTINENQLEKEKEDNLLSNLLPDNDTTTVLEPLNTLITDTKMIDTSVIHKDEMSNEILESLDDEVKKEKKIEKDIEKEEDKESDLEVDESLKDETKTNKKIIFIIIGIILLIAIVFGILVWKKVIKF